MNCWPLNKGSLLALSATLLVACSNSDSLDRIVQRGELLVVSRNGPATFYEDKGGPAGFEHALSSRFADELGVRLRMEVRHDIGDILQSVRRGQADFAAAGLTITPLRQAEFDFSLPYADIQSQVIYYSGTSRPRQIEDLYNNRLVVLAHSSHAESLRQLQPEYPDLKWEEIREAEPQDLMDMVTSGAATFALLDSNEFVAIRSFYPKLRVGFEIPPEGQLAWLFTANSDSDRLRLKVDAFFAAIHADGSLEQLKEQHFGHAWGVTQVDSQTFSRRMRNRLPTYEAEMRAIADEYQLNWHMLAAISYQESHWNPYARSPTGVRGMMMLTSNTALEMGVENRLDPTQSLRGGARYFKKIKRLLPADIEEPDRTWFALAAYNIGRGHLEDARVITERQGGDPHLWADVKLRLPLLQKSKYYRKTKHGYARGSEPVTYVKNIRHYYNILAWQDINKNSTPAPISVDEYLPEILRTSRLSAL
jgi:membrane-bound lytic murein transglycosylase F